MWSNWNCHSLLVEVSSGMINFGKLAVSTTAKHITYGTPETQFIGREICALKPMPENVIAAFSQ